MFLPVRNKEFMCVFDVCVMSVCGRRWWREGAVVMCVLLLMSHDFPALAALQNVLALARCLFFSSSCLDLH